MGRLVSTLEASRAASNAWVGWSLHTMEASGAASTAWVGWCLHWRPVGRLAMRG